MNNPAKVLIAENHPLYKEDLKIILGRINHPFIVIPVNNGETLLQKLAEIVPDLIFLEFKLSQKVEVDCLRFIKRTCAAVKMIVLSTGHDITVVNRVYDGKDGYLLINPNPDQLQKCMKAVFIERNN